MASTPTNIVIELIFSLVDKFFELYKLKEDDSPPVLRRMDEDLASKRSSEIASRWLKNCLEKHSLCRPTTEFPNPPKRLIHVGNDTQHPFLVETFPDRQRVRWLSLSYCWGGETSMSLNHNTMDKLKNGVPLVDLDEAIQDAISVTRSLGIEYIWIDALCLRQDNNEWNDELQKMNEIYGGSIVTLVSASSDSVKNRFLNKRNLDYIPVAYSTDPEDRRAKIFLSQEWNDSACEYNGPWSKRGWTMQEGLLPNRVLFYTASQLVWKCCEEQSFERGVTERIKDRISEILTYSDHDNIGFGSGFLWTLPTFLRFKRFKDYLPTCLDITLMSHSDTFRLWYDLIEDYTQRQFQDIDDRLRAISSLARMYSAMIQNLTYVAGLWREDLIRGLMWYVPGATLISHGSADKPQASLKAFPSWSWADVGYEIVKNDLKSQDGLYAFSNIENVQIDLDNVKEPFSTVRSGRISINGPLKRLSKLYYKDWMLVEAPITKLERYISQIVDEECQGNIPQRYSSPLGGHFGILIMLGNIGLLYLLVLETTGCDTLGATIYRRVGILKLQYTDRSSYLSPALVAMRKEAQTSITARFGLRKTPRKVRPAPNDVFMEVKKADWVKETVMVV